MKLFKKSLKKRVLNRAAVLASLLVFLLGLTACGGSGTKQADNSESQANTSKTAAAENSESEKETAAAEDSQSAEETAAVENGQTGGESAGLTENADGFYEIYTAEDFVAYAEMMKEASLAATPLSGQPLACINIYLSAVLMADIDLSEAIPEGSDLLPLGGPYKVEEDGAEIIKAGDFSGTFDGNGHTISGIHVEGTVPNEKLSGMFPGTAGLTGNN